MQETDEPPEDDLSIRAHLLALQRECGKSSPSDSVIKEKLEKTTSHRAEMVRSQPVDEVLKAYPCLRQEQWVSINLLLHQRCITLSNFCLTRSMPTNIMLFCTVCCLGMDQLMTKMRTFVFCKKPS